MRQEIGFTMTIENDDPVIRPSLDQLDRTGATDQTALLEEWLAHVATAAEREGGAVAELPTGAYRVSRPLVIRNDAVWLRGGGSSGETKLPSQGGSGTLIIPDSSFPSGQTVLQFKEPQDRRPLFGNRLSGIRVATLAESPCQADVNGILWSVYRGQMLDAFVCELSGHGLIVRGTPGWNTYESKFYNVHLRRNGRIGLFLDQNTADMHFTDCVVHGNDLGLYTEGGASCHYNSVHFTGNRTNAYLDGGGSRSKFDECKLECAHEHNVVLDTTKGAIVDLFFGGGTNFNCNCCDLDGTYDGIHTKRDSGGAVVNAVISGATFQDISGPTSPRTYINLGPNAREWRIGNVHFGGTPTQGPLLVHPKAARCTLNLFGTNQGDPNLVGEWYSRNEKGMSVIDEVNQKLYYCIGPNWIPIANLP